MQRLFVIIAPKKLKSSLFLQRLMQEKYMSWLKWLFLWIIHMLFPFTLIVVSFVVTRDDVSLFFLENNEKWDFSYGVIQLLFKVYLFSVRINRKLNFRNTTMIYRSRFLKQVLLFCFLIKIITNTCCFEFVHQVL